MEARRFGTNIYIVVPAQGKNYYFAYNFIPWEDFAVEELKEARKIGMSGCLYGPRVLGQEVWHVTMGGKEYNSPLLLKNPPSGIENAEVIPWTSPLLPPHLDEKDYALMLYQIAKAYSLRAAKEVASLYPSFARVYPLVKVYMRPLRKRLTVYPEIFYERIPEERGKIDIDFGRIEITVPAVGYNSVSAVLVADQIKIRVGSRTYVIVYVPSPNHVIAYKVLFADMVTVRRIVGYEYYRQITHPACEIDPRYYSSSFIDFLCAKRLGDVLFLTPDDLRHVPRELTPASERQLQRIQRISATLLHHPEHGYLEIDENAQPYQVPYISRGHD